MNLKGCQHFYIMGVSCVYGNSPGQAQRACLGPGRLISQNNEVTARARCCTLLAADWTVHGPVGANQGWSLGVAANREGLPSGPWRHLKP